MIGRYVPLHLIARGAEQGGHGASPCGQDGREHQDEKAVLRWCRKRGSKHAEYGHGTRGAVHRCRPVMERAVAWGADTFAAFHHKRSDFPTPVPSSDGEKGNSRAQCGIALFDHLFHGRLKRPGCAGGQGGDETREGIHRLLLIIEQPLS